ncbi:MAG: PD-(D/E)XK nuclease family transposase, partial [Alphaproteobacteria bacterium]|nr:PD-(D/E)XK nuclease family transposase [Alphaproteobacteria bacterium]
MRQLLDPKLDYIFKNIFGVEKNKRLLISLLNAILDNNPKINEV